MAETATCLYCGESIELAEDGAWQGAEDGACGCTASTEQGGAGEHEPSEGACVECGAPVEQHWVGACPDAAELTATVAPDDGLPVEFLTAVAERLSGQGVAASVEYPGILTFEAGARRWATGFTGLHVTDADGAGDELPGAERLVALEHEGTITVGRYVTVLLGVIREQLAPN